MTTGSQGYINMGSWDVQRITSLLGALSFLPTQQRVATISKAMLGIPYNDKTLIGDVNTKEELVINLAAVDCFTFLDYVEAMRRSKDFGEFKDNLISVRYRARKIDFQYRNHFFTDWISYGHSSVFDITELLGGASTKIVNKTLNLKKDRSNYLQGLPPVKRTIRYIPSSKINKNLLRQLQTGDYIGIYTRQQGLDVSHVGIFIRDELGREVLRHASSVKGKVVDQDFIAYVLKTPGIVVLRPKE